MPRSRSSPRCWSPLRTLAMSLPNRCHRIRTTPFNVPDFPFPPRYFFCPRGAARTGETRHLAKRATGARLNSGGQNARLVCRANRKLCLFTCAPGLFRSFLSGDYAGNLHPFGAGRCAKCGRKSRAFAYWTQMDSSCGNPEFGIVCNAMTPLGVIGRGERI